MLTQTFGEAMTSISFGRMGTVEPAVLLQMLENPDVRRHMPLAGDDWTEQSAFDWAKGKEAQWQQNGYGPWAVYLDDVFAGWGGFQKEGDETDLGLVLLPQHWGHGARIFRELVARGRDMKLTNITIMLPPSRRRLKSLERLGFVSLGDVEYEGTRFHKFRLL